MSPTPLTKLLLNKRRAEGARVRLICLPFAGGGATIYRDWGDLLPEWVDVCAVELPGHGARLVETPIDDMSSLIDELAGDLAPLFDRPVVWFGHSMGGRVAFLLAQRTVRSAALIVSGSLPIHLPVAKPLAHLDRDAFLAELEKMGGMAPEILADPELLDLFLPTLRADFRLVDGFVAPANAVVSCPLVALVARDDRRLDVEKAPAWATRTTGGFRLAETDGGHFFLQTRQSFVIDEVKKVLATYVGGKVATPA